MTIWQLLLKFVSKDELNIQMLNPWLHNGFVYATNAHILIKIPASMFDHEYYENSKAPNAEKVISELQFLEKPFFVSAGKIKSYLSKLEKVPVYQNCSWCHGEGDYTCDHCDSLVDCRYCHGSGETGNEIGKRYNHTADLIQIKGINYNPNFIELVIEASEVVGCDKIQVLAHGDRKPLYVQIGDVNILLMPVAPYDIEDESPVMHEIEWEE